MTATIAILAVGAIGVFGYVGIIEPFAQAPLDPPASLGWGDPGGTTVRFAAIAMLSLLLVIIIWFVSAPVRRDRRQGFRSR